MVSSQHGWSCVLQHSHLMKPCPWEAEVWGIPAHHTLHNVCRSLITPPWSVALFSWRYLLAPFLFSRRLSPSCSYVAFSLFLSYLHSSSLLPFPSPPLLNSSLSSSTHPAPPQLIIPLPSPHPSPPQLTLSSPLLLPSLPFSPQRSGEDSAVRVHSVVASAMSQEDSTSPPYSQKNCFYTSSPFSEKVISVKLLLCARSLLDLPQTGSCGGTSFWGPLVWAGPMCTQRETQNWSRLMSQHYRGKNSLVWWWVSHTVPTYLSYHVCVCVWGGGVYNIASMYVRIIALFPFPLLSFPPFPLLSFPPLPPLPCSMVPSM